MGREVLGVRIVPLEVLKGVLFWVPIFFGTHDWDQGREDKDPGGRRFRRGVDAGESGQPRPLETPLVERTP